MHVCGSTVTNCSYQQAQLQPPSGRASVCTWQHYSFVISVSGLHVCPCTHSARVCVGVFLVCLWTQEITQKAGVERAALRLTEVKKKIISGELYINRHLVNERQCGKSYRICQESTCNALWVADSITECDRSLCLPILPSFISSLSLTIINETERNRR